MGLLRYLVESSDLNRVLCDNDIVTFDHTIFISIGLPNWAVFYKSLTDGVANFLGRARFKNCYLWRLIEYKDEFKLLNDFSRMGFS